MNRSNVPRNPPGTRERVLVRCKRRPETGMQVFFKLLLRAVARGLAASTEFMSRATNKFSARIFLQPMDGPA